jgi:hypothetical protein
MAKETAYSKEKQLKASLPFADLGDLRIDGACLTLCAGRTTLMVDTSTRNGNSNVNVALGNPIELGLFISALSARYNRLMALQNKIVSEIPILASAKEIKG